MILKEVPVISESVLYVESSLGVHTSHPNPTEGLGRVEQEERSIHPWGAIRKLYFMYSWRPSAVQTYALRCKSSRLSYVID